MAETHCGEAHGAVVTRLTTVETLAASTEHDLREHCRNGGTGHVGRTEFAELRQEVRSLKALLVKAVIAVALAAGGGSTLAPTIAKLLGG
jgi:hypothetical protein